MATFHINRGGTNLGTFSEDEVRDGLRSGKFFGTDLGWREGMATWEPLAQISEFAQEAGSGGAASPQPQFIGASTITPTPTIAPRSGLPWDDRQQRGILRAFFDTLIMVLTKPAEAFAVMKREGGLGEPLLYAIIGGSVGGVIYFLYNFLLGSPAPRHPYLRRAYRGNLENRALLYRFRPRPRDRHRPRRPGSAPSGNPL